MLTMIAPGIQLQTVQGRHITRVQFTTLGARPDELLITDAAGAHDILAHPTAYVLEQAAEQNWNTYAYLPLLTPIGSPAGFPWFIRAGSETATGIATRRSGTSGINNYGGMVRPPFVGGTAPTPIAEPAPFTPPDASALQLAVYLYLTNVTQVEMLGVGNPKAVTLITATGDIDLLPHLQRGAHFSGPWTWDGFGTLAVASTMPAVIGSLRLFRIGVTAQDDTDFEFSCERDPGWPGSSLLGPYAGSTYGIQYS